MKKITLLTMFFMLFCIGTYGQFGCDQAVVITDGFSQSAITTPGNGGIEDWNTNPVGTTINAAYWDDDVYLFQYTAGTTDEFISMTTFSRSSWNGIGIFTTCTGNTFSGQLSAVGTTGANSTKTVTATIGAGQTVYIATGQWGTPDNLDFDVVSFSATPIVLPPNCDAALTSPANGATDAILTGVLSWSAATGNPTGYKLKVGTTSGGAEIGDFVLGNVTTYNIPGILEGDTQYFVNITPTNANGDATDCTEYSFTTGPAPVEGSLCENALVVDALPYLTTDTTANYADVYYEGSPGAAGCGTTSGYLNGNDVVYSYTATFTGTMKVLLTPDTGNTYGGIFVYSSCANIGVNCIGSAFGSNAAPKMIEELPVTTGETYYFVISTWASPQTISYTLELSENTCSNGAATYTVVSDCEEGEQFLVDVNVTDLGSATSMTISDDQGSASITISETGISTFGPYPNGTPVIFNIYNDQDETCFLTSPAMNQTVCPPLNNTCATAIDLTEEVSPLSGSTVGATNDSTPTCGANTAPDVFYSILVPAGSTLTIGQTVNNYDSRNYVFYGTCDTPTQIACFDDPDDTTVVWSNDTGSDQTVYWVQDGYLSASGTYTLAWSVIACTQAEATYTVVSDCEEGEQFLVDVNVTDLGSATSVSVFDDQGSEVQNLSATGIVTFGPYPNGTPVIFSVINDQDDNCTLTSPAMNQANCPPLNNTCATAIDLTEEVSPLSGSTVGATNDSTPTCGANTAPDVFYSILVPVGSTLTIGQTENNYDSRNYVFYGDCDTPTQIACFDDPDTTTVVWANNTGADQTVYWVQDGYLGNSGTFTLAWSVIACTQAQATYTVVSDCQEGEQFLVDVNVTDFGSATSVSVSDDQGSAIQNLSATGTVTFGPYPNGTPVIFNVINDQDDNCTLTSPAMNQTVCPPNCDEAQVIEFCDEEIAVTLVAGAGAWNGVGACGYTTSGTEAIYSFTPDATGTYELEVTTATGGYVDYFYKAADGNCVSTGWTCIDDIINAGVYEIGELTEGVEYLILLDGESTTEKTQTFKINCLPTCENGTATYTVVSDCENGEQFMVDVNVTSLGTATSVTVSDDQGSATQNATATGVLTFGPYANNSPVIFTIANDQDETCVWTSSAINQLACPPANDNCEFATPMTITGDFESSAIVFDTTGATMNPNNPLPTCGAAGFATNGKDVWYQSTAPESGNVVVETRTNGGLTDTVVAVYTGTCDNLVLANCDDDGGIDTYSLMTFTGLTPGVPLYIRVWGYNGAQGTALLGCYDAALSTNTFDNSGFKAYPNPVRDILNLTYTQNITNVEVFNALGQQVLTKSVNATQDQVDMSNLAMGTYLVKVTADNQVKTIKVIKQ